MGTPRPYGTPAGAHLQVSREASTASSAALRGAGSKSSKRPIQEVIDLTSSGDEDEEPVDRAPKRQFSSHGLSIAPPVYRGPAPGYPRA